MSMRRSRHYWLPALAAALALLTGRGSLAFAATPSSLAAVTPASVTRAFFGWYVALLVKDGEPMVDQPARFAQFTTADLRREIKRQMASPDGLEADYFTGAQDYDDDWPSHLTVTGGSVTGATATTTVTIGANGSNRMRRMVILRREAGGWRIARVTSAR